MWRKIRLAVCFATLCFLSLASSSCGVCYAAEATYQITATELDALSSHLTALERNNETLRTAWNESSADLEEALNALKASDDELRKLKAELETYRREAQTSKERLETANRELQLAVQSLKESEADKAKTEKSLKKQLTIWKILFGVAIGTAGAGFICG